MSHERVSHCRLDECCHSEPKPRSGGRVGLEAGALAGGVVGTHYLGLGNHAMLLLREGIAVYREKQVTMRYCSAVLNTPCIYIYFYNKNDHKIEKLFEKLVSQRGYLLQTVTVAYLTIHRGFNFSGKKVSTVPILQGNIK